MKRRNFFKLGSAAVVLFSTFSAKAFVNLLMLKKAASVTCLGGSTVNLTISANTQNYNIFTAAGSPASCVLVNLTINSGIYVWSDDNTLAALDFGALPAGSTVSIVNSGYIMGKGGRGEGVGALAGNYVVEGPGGNAIKMTCNATIDSQVGYILGGGGGGKLGGSYPGGGGAGGGAGGFYYANGGCVAGSSGAIGMSGGNGSTAGTDAPGGGGGGRVVPSTTTMSTSASTNTKVGGLGGPGGGTGPYCANKSAVVTSGGSGGGLGIAGGAATSGVSNDANHYAGSGGGGGGGYGASGGDGMDGTTVYSGGASGGKSVALNGHVVTWVGGLGANKAYGAIS